VNELVSDKLNTWNDYGIGITSGSKKDNNYKENSFLDGKFLDKLASKVLNEHKVKAAATDMVVQYLVSNAETFKMFIGDLAQFWKPDRNSQTIVERIEDTFNNIGKRLASDIAPGTELANSASNNYIQIYMEDAKAASKELNSRLKNLLDKSDWRKYGENITDRFDATDAQEYTTVKEHLYVLRGLGRITDEQYDKFIDKYNKQLTSIKTSNTISNDDKFTYEELGIVLQPVKPVYVGNSLEKEKDFVRTLLINYNLTIFSSLVITIIIQN